MSETIEQDEIKVSVIVITYNHEKYIRKALDSILMQKVNFKYEILVGDDASIDSTPDILREYENIDKIKLTLRNNNVGSTRNSYELYMKAEGQYIFTLEGDDYWTDEYKMFKQVEFLENHPQYIGCVCDVDIINEFGESYNAEKTIEMKKVLYGESKVYTIKDYNDGKMPGHACALVYKNFFHDIDASILYKAHPIVGDITIALFLVSLGDVYRMEDTMACYRRNLMGTGSSWSASTNKNIFHFYELFKFHTYLEKYASDELGLTTSLKKRKKVEFFYLLEDCKKYPSLAKRRCIRNMLKMTQEKMEYIKILYDSLYLVRLEPIVRMAIINNTIPLKNTETWYEFKEISQNKKVIIWGGGGGCKAFLTKYYDSFNVSYIVDNSERVWGEYILGYKIYPPSVLKDESSENIVVLISTEKWIEEISKQLINYGINNSYSYVSMESKAARYRLLRKHYKRYDYLTQ